ncbi:MAG: Ig-like domain-containing protein [Gemmatimonadales bacterium]
MSVSRLALLVVVFTVSGCGSGSPSPTNTTAVVTTVNVSLAATSIAAATTTTATAAVLDQNGATLTGRTVTWSSGSPTIATVNASGTVTGVAAGQAEIIATVEGKTGQAPVQVTPAPVATVSVSAPSTSLVPGQTTQAAATVKDAAGTTLTGRTVTWMTSDPSAVTVSATGLATAVLPGTATITATSEAKSGTAQLSVHAPPIAQESQGLTGYVSVLVNNNVPNDAMGYGFGYYSLVATLSTTETAGTQLGWGSWLIPDNATFGAPLCPTGTVARDDFTDRGPTWWSVFQTIEGGMGEWTSTRFPSSTPKYRINGTPDCYDTQIGSTGWAFGGGALSGNELGLAQLSNRVLTPPDGFTFVGASGPAYIGEAWLALPLISAGTAPDGTAAGDQSWTLFLRAANFTGPVAFYTPAIWSAISALNPAAAGRGQDAIPGFTGSAALEIGTTPMFTSQDSNGVRYRRVPRLMFADDGSGQAVLVQDMRTYSRSAIWDAVANWVQSGTVATQIDQSGTALAVLDAGNLGVTLGGSTVTPNALFAGGRVTTGGGVGLGMRWTGAMTPGVFPEYYVESGGTWSPVAASSVPRTTWLQDQTFTPLARSSYPAVDQSAGSPWTSTHWSAGPFSVALRDGSVLDYVWYRFVDQPAIARLGLSDPELQQLQAFVVSLHQHSGVSGLAIPPLSSGQLVTMDPALFVTPPAGMENGYVPVVIDQH